MGLVRRRAIGNDRCTMIGARIDSQRGDSITVVNIRQKTLNRADKHAEQHHEGANAADSGVDRLSPTDHDDDTRITGSTRRSLSRD